MFVLQIGANGLSDGQTGSDGVPYEKFADGTSKDLSDEIPFDLPQGWVWARLGEIGDIITGATPKTSNREFFDGNIPFIKPADLGVSKYITNTTETLTELGAKQVRPIPEKAVCVCCIGSLGKASITLQKSCTNQQINSIVSASLSPEFIYYLISSEYFINYLNSLASAITISLVNKSRMASILIPLPPLAEQKRIIAKVEELFAYADKIGSASEEITKTSQRLDKKILDLAIRGKLVPQDPNDEPASELVKRIEATRNEKTGSIKSRATASHKPTYEIEPPFDIPESWQWVRLGDVFEIANKVVSALFPTSAPCGAEADRYKN